MGLLRSLRRTAVDVGLTAVGLLRSPRNAVVQRLRPVGLLRSQRNAVFQRLAAKRLNPGEFEWSSGISVLAFFAQVSVLTHRSSGYFFRFELGLNGGFRCEFTPSDETGGKTVSGPWGERTATWRQVLMVVDHWVTNLSREIGSPDLWAAGQGQRLVQGERGRAENERFSATDVMAIEASMVEIRDYVVTTYKLSSDQADRLDGRLDYLVSAAKRLGRIDWKNIAVTVLLSTAVEIIRDSEQVRAFLDFCASVLPGLVMSVPQLPSR